MLYEVITHDASLRRSFPMSLPDENARFASLRAAVLELQQDIAAEVERRRAQIDATLPGHRASALRNNFV